MVLWWSPFNNVSDSPRPPFKMAAVTKNRNFISCQFLLYCKSKSTQILSAATMYMAMSSLTYILFFYCDIFSASLFRLGILWDKKSFAQKFELKWSLGGLLSKWCVTPPFSINFRCQIENQVSDYRLLGASS